MVLTFIICILPCPCFIEISQYDSDIFLYQNIQLVSDFVIEAYKSKSILNSDLKVAFDLKRLNSLTLWFNYGKVVRRGDQLWHQIVVSLKKNGQAIEI